VSEGDYILHVSASSVPTKVATAISRRFNSDYINFGNDALVEIQAIGPNAISNAMTSVVLARDFLAPTGVNLICVPAFGKFNTKSGEVRNGLRLILRLEGR